MGISRRDLIKQGGLFALTASLFKPVQLQSEEIEFELQDANPESEVEDVTKIEPEIQRRIECLIDSAVGDICRSLRHFTSFKTTAIERQRIQNCVEDCVTDIYLSKKATYPEELYPLFGSLHKDVTKKGFNRNEALTELETICEEVNHDVIVA